MFGEERHRQILELLQVRKTASVHFLAKSLYASEATVRRDLIRLESQGFLKRTYGGAILIEGNDREIPFSYRETENRSSKPAIAEKAVQFVHEYDSLILDSSSTVLQMAQYLRSFTKLTIVTNGLKLTQLLSESANNKVYCTGGMLRENSLSFVGSSTERFVSDFQVDTLFFSCRAISRTGHITEGNEAEANLRRVMLTHAKQKILLCDASKFDKTALMRISYFDAIDYLITDKVPNSDWREMLNRYGVKIVCGST